MKKTHITLLTILAVITIFVVVICIIRGQGEYILTVSSEGSVTVTRTKNSAGNTTATTNELEELIRSLPNADFLPAKYRLPDGIEPMISTPKGKEAAVKQYRKNVAELADSYLKLKSHLIKGESVLTYPGLLSKGDIEYDENSKQYHIILGIYDRIEHAGSQGVFGPYRLTFDSKGVIIAIEDVVYKH